MKSIVKILSVIMALSFAIDMPVVASNRTLTRDERMAARNQRLQQQEEAALNAALQEVASQEGSSKKRKSRSADSNDSVKSLSTTSIAASEGGDGSRLKRVATSTDTISDDFSADNSAEGRMDSFSDDESVSSDSSSVEESVIENSSELAGVVHQLLTVVDSEVDSSGSESSSDDGSEEDIGMIDQAILGAVINQQAIDQTLAPMGKFIADFRASIATLRAIPGGIASRSSAAYQRVSSIPANARAGYNSLRESVQSGATSLNEQRLAFATSAQERYVALGNGLIGARDRLATARDGVVSFGRETVPAAAAGARDWTIHQAQSTRNSVASYDYAGLRKALFAELRRLIGATPEELKSVLVTNVIYTLANEYAIYCVGGNRQLGKFVIPAIAAVLAVRASKEAKDTMGVAARRVLYFQLATIVSAMIVGTRLAQTGNLIDRVLLRFGNFLDRMEFELWGKDFGFWGFNLDIHWSKVFAKFWGPLFSTIGSSVGQWVPSGFLAGVVVWDIRNAHGSVSGWLDGLMARFLQPVDTSADTSITQSSSVVSLSQDDTLDLEAGLGAGNSGGTSGDVHSEEI